MSSETNCGEHNVEPDFDPFSPEEVAKAKAEANRAEEELEKHTVLKVSASLRVGKRSFLAVYRELNKGQRFVDVAVQHKLGHWSDIYSARSYEPENVNLSAHDHIRSVLMDAVDLFLRFDQEHRGE